MIVDGAGVRARRHTGRVGLWVPAEASQLTILRAVTETVLLTADFTLDVVTDVRVALDEVATAIVLSAVPDGTIECEFVLDSGQVEVTVSAVTASGDVFAQNDFARHLLGAMTDTMRIAHENLDHQRGGYPLSVYFVRRT
ncbi:ATP-binding protein [Nocardia yunnanensis]|nr:ATP-binding protein [Nocardia yunnanensis]